MMTTDSLYRPLRTDCHEIRVLHIEPLQQGEYEYAPVKVRLGYMVIGPNPNKDADAMAKSILDTFKQRSSHILKPEFAFHDHGVMPDDASVKALEETRRELVKVWYEKQAEASGEKLAQEILEEYFDKEKPLSRAAAEKFTLLKGLVNGLASPVPRSAGEQDCGNLTELIKMVTLTYKQIQRDPRRINELILAACMKLLARFRFMALSYTWKDPDQGEPLLIPIIINGVEKRVTGNLFAALIDIRREFLFNPLPLWADALCINQDDIAERNREVKRMRDVYAKASKTIIHLGRVSEEWNIAGLYPKIDPEATPPLKSRIHVPHGKHRVELPELPYNIEEMLSCIAMLERPYWERVWVYQELFMANDENLFFFWGSRLYPLSRLTQAVQVFNDEISVTLLSPDPTSALTIRNKIHTARAQTRVGHANKGARQTFAEYESTMGVAKDGRDLGFSTVISNRYKEIRTNFEQIQTACLSKGSFVNDHISWYATLIERARTAQATDEKDLVYGLLGIQPESLSRLVEPDYALPKERVFLDFTMALIRSQGLNTICCEFSGWIPTDSRKRSTWVLDFQAIRSYPRRFKMSQTHRSNWPRVVSQGCEKNWRSFSASGASDPKANGIRFTVDKRQMHCSAVLLDMLPEPGYDKTRYPNDDAVRGALRRVFAWQARNSDTPSPSIFSKPWPPPFVRKTPLGQIPEFSEMVEFDPWYEDNSNTTIEGQPIARWFPSSKSRVECADVDWASLFDSLWLVRGQRIITTCNGWLGLGPDHSREGDFLVILHGCNVPLLVREEEEGYSLVGPCYIDGMMSGEIVQDGVEWDEITIV